MAITVFHVVSIDFGHVRQFSAMSRRCGPCIVVAKRIVITTRIVITRGFIVARRVVIARIIVQIFGILCSRWETGELVHGWLMGLCPVEIFNWCALLLMSTMRMTLTELVTRRELSARQIRILKVW
jgi:hypothetical protein